MAALNVLAKLPTAHTTSQINFASQLKPFKTKKGLLNTKKVPASLLPDLRHLIGMSSTETFLGKGNMFSVIVDSGCTISATPFKEDFVPGTFKKLEDPILIEGVGGDVSVTHEGIVHWEFISDKGEIVDLSHKAHFSPDLKEARLLSPQHFFEDRADDNGFFEVTRRGAVLTLGSGSVIEVPIDKLTGLPIVLGFPDAKKTAQ